MNSIGKEFSASYALNGGDKIVLMIADDLVANDVIFGLVTAMVAITLMLVII